LYNDNPFRQSWYETGPGVVVLTILLMAFLFTVVLFFGTQWASTKRENALKHAQELQLKNYNVHCDETPWSCGCTITWEVEYGQRTEKFACCGWGCE
jgi:hypothetical protein